MSNLLATLVGGRERGISLDQLANLFTFGGVGYNSYPLTSLGSPAEEIGGDFAGMAQSAYKGNGVVFSCMDVRMKLFSEARFQYQQMRRGRPGDLFGTDALRVLERPYPGGTTRDLLARAIQDADISGNWYGARISGGIRRLRPDWVTIVLGSRRQTDRPSDASDAEVVGYIYHPGGRGGSDPTETFLPDEVAHFAPIPDPSARYRGMSWLTPILREISADLQMTAHQSSFLEKGATPNMIVSLQENNPDNFKRWVDEFNARHGGAANAYKTLFLGAGADATVVGSDFKQIDFKQVRGHGETRVAAAAGVPPVIVGLSEGLAAATYSNYGQARRRFADGTMRPLWGLMADALSSVVPVPGGARLYYDDRDIPFLQEDVADEAAIQETQARTIRTLVDGGFTPESSVSAVMNGDMTMLQHTGLFSVQLQEPGAGEGTGEGTEPPQDEPDAESESIRRLGELTLSMSRVGLATTYGVTDGAGARKLVKDLAGVEIPEPAEVPDPSPAPTDPADPADQ